jgi:hypothetical protein
MWTHVHTKGPPLALNGLIVHGNNP